MSSHHDHDHHVTEKKPVAFRTPLILALVTVLIIVLAVSTCDKKHGCCEGDEHCTEECAKGNEHGEHGGHEAKTEAHGAATTHEEEHHAADTTAVAATTDSLSHKADTTHAAPAAHH